MTKANSRYSFVIGDNMRSRTFSQNENCINSVIIIFMVNMRNTYKPHWTSQMRADGGFPGKTKKKPADKY